MSRAVMQKVLSSLMNLQPIIANGLLDKRQLAFIDPHLDVACEALIAELAKPEQEPVAYGVYIDQKWVVIDAKGRTLEAPWMRLYTSPPQRQELTDAEIKAVLVSLDPETKRLPSGLRDFARAVIKAHNTKEKS